MKRYIQSSSFNDYPDKVERFNKIVENFYRRSGKYFPGFKIELKDLDFGGTIYVVNIYNADGDLQMARINNVAYNDEEIWELLVHEASKISENGLTLKSLLQVLENANIDTTVSRYELCAESYERYEQGKLYKKQFNCRGDYLAYFSMLLHRSPTVNNLKEYFGSTGEFEDFVESNPTVADMEDHASSSWYGDGDDYIIYLKNLNNGKVLYQGDYEEFEEEYDDDFDD